MKVKYLSTERIIVLELEQSGLKEESCWMSLTRGREQRSKINAVDLLGG
jgi:hypothetical protein